MFGIKKEGKKEKGINEERREIKRISGREEKRWRLEQIKRK